MTSTKHHGKFRHIFGQPAKSESRFLEIKNPNCSGEGSYVCANARFFAVAKAGGGGPVYIQRHDKPGRLPASTPMLSVHKGTTWDFDFHPFIDNMIATASNDCRVAVTSFPSDGLTETIHDPTVVLEGHGKKATLCQFNPCANSILATGSFDRTVRVWNIETATPLSVFDQFGENVYSLEWNYDGSQILATAKDKRLRIFDPRIVEEAASIPSFDGTKSNKGFWVDRHQWVGAVGFSKTAKRQLKLWDRRKLDAGELFTMNIDQASGVFMPRFDNDNGVLYMAAKGEGNVSYYELVNDEKKVYTLGLYRNSTPQKGGGWLPKKGLDVWRCEVQRFLKLTKSAVIPISFIVPRKAGGDVFQDDIYPDALAGKPALSAAAWEGGENQPPVLMSLDPAKRNDDGQETVAFQKKATYGELLQQNAELKKENAELRNEIKALKERLGEADDEQKQSDENTDEN